MPHCCNATWGHRPALQPPLEDFDRTLDSAKLAVRKPFELIPKERVRGRAAAQLVASGIGQPERQPSPIGRIRLPLDQTSAHQRLNRSANCRSAAPDGCRNLVERRRLPITDRSKELLSRNLGPFGRSVCYPSMGDVDEAGRKPCGRVGSGGDLRHDNRLNSSTVARVKCSRLALCRMRRKGKA